jgi:hypothetical protein
MLRIRSRESGGYSYVFAQGPSEVKLTAPQRWQGVEACGVLLFLSLFKL